MNQKFISTSDEHTYKQLLSLGFQEVKNSNGLYTFINKPITFESDDIDKSKIQYSNMLCI
jgi:major membrane immunogen (membrane-anchored lipoprotein)